MKWSLKVIPAVMLGAVAGMVPAGAALAHEGHETSGDDHSTVYLCSYTVAGEQDRANGKVLKGSLDKKSVPYVVDWNEKTVSRIDQHYPATITDQSIEFKIGAVSYVLNRANLTLTGRSQQKVIAGSSTVNIDGSCTPKDTAASAAKP